MTAKLKPIAAVTQRFASRDGFLNGRHNHSRPDDCRFGDARTSKNPIRPLTTQTLQDKGEIRAVTTKPFGNGQTLPLNPAAGRAM
jgi:hypothetical protein